MSVRKPDDRDPLEDEPIDPAAETEESLLRKLGERELEPEEHERLYREWEETAPVTAAEIENQNGHLVRRQQTFRRAADLLAAAFREVAAVQRVALIGSVAVPLKKEVPRFRRFRARRVALWDECQDLDLAVWLTELSVLGQLRKLIPRTLRAAGDDDVRCVAAHQVEVFMLEPGTDRYRGRLCHFNQCPKGKRECLVPGCGAPEFLQQHQDFTFRPESIDPSRAIVLFDRPSGGL